MDEPDGTHETASGHTWCRNDVVAEPAQRDRDLAPRDGAVVEALAAFADTGARLATSASLAEALAVLVDTAAACARADVVVARTRNADGQCLVARAVSTASVALSAELEGSRLAAADLPLKETTDVEALPGPVRRACARAGATAALLVPVRADGKPVGSLELLRAGDPFDDEEQALARLAAGHLALAVRALQDRPHDAPLGRERALELLGDALAAGEEDDAGPRIARIAALATRARAALVWLADEERGPVCVGTHGELEASTEFEAAAAAALGDRATTRVEPATDDMVLATMRLGEPPLGVIQLVFARDAAPSQSELSQLATLAVRAAQSLRSGERVRMLHLELERTRALLAVLGQAIAQLSLAHTLETATARVSELLGIDRVAVYLLEGDRLEAAASRGLEGPHAEVARRLLDLALGPYRARGLLVVLVAPEDRRLAGVAEAVAESHIEMVLAVPLRAHDEVIGLLAAYPPLGRAILPGESSLLTALAAQLAVAVQNARLHERAKQLGAELEQALIAERQTARQLRALSEISGSFVEHLSLERTLEAVARTAVKAFDLDAAAIRVPVRRRGELVTRAVHVAEGAPAEPLRALLSAPLPVQDALVEFAPTAVPVVLHGDQAHRLGGAHDLLTPFLAKGSTAAVVPVAKKTELLATLTLLSLDPTRPVTERAALDARSLAAQAALAIDNARLYQHQRDFADTMQRSLLARTEPRIEGYELAHVYESAAHVDVGGDVYDFLPLGGGRLAFVLGDVTGHGIEAAADMALAKFVFRTLAREHPEPGEFLARANHVMLGEMELGRFITMTYLVLDVERGEVVCASAGHPSPRVVRSDGTVVALAASGLALGVDAEQVYDETRAPLAPGESVVLYTDGVVEARREGALYGTERLDRLLAAQRDKGPKDVAAAVLEDCRAFGGGELVDDCAIVIVKRDA